ncbi:MAG: fasciclin domain-containing protein, partial [Prevotellaceae bacterium]|nr:fasciclin domain-containing protein [Prevotellaceae bacterium]
MTDSCMPMFCYKRILLLCLSCCLLFSCSDEIDKRDMYTFTGMTAADFIRKRPELSLFAQLMDISQVSDRSLSTVGSLLGVYGNYTVFAPNNEAITAYLDEYYGKGNYSLDTIPEALARKIVNISVINAPLKTTRLNSGFLVPTTLSNAHLYVEFGDFGDGCTVRLNDHSRILRSDMETDNGCVNIIDHVIIPGPSTIPGLIAETDNLRIFSRLLSVTSWADSLLEYNDYSFKDLPGFNPYYHLINYTVLTETDEVFQKDWGVPAPVLDEEGRMTNWNEILEVIQEHCAAITPEASSSDYTSKDNAVNQFVSYHLLPFLAKYDYWACLRGEYGTNTYRYEKGIDHRPYHLDTPTHAVHYHQTMGQPNRLIQITYLPQKDKEGLYANRHALYDLSYGGDYQELSCPREGVLILPSNGHRKQYAPNGIYYPLNHVLTYDKDVPEKVLNTRIRYNPVMNLPEIITNCISLPS